MNKLEDQNGKVGNVNVEVIEGIVHSSKRLIPFCQDELLYVESTKKTDALEHSTDSAPVE